MSASQRDRLHSETQEERAARLHRVSACRQEQLEAETCDEREARLQVDRERHRENSRCFLCLKSHQLEPGCTSFMNIWLLWTYQDAPHAQRGSLDSSFTHSQLSVCAVAGISTHRSCTPLLTTWTLAPYHLNCRLVSTPMQLPL